MTPKRLSVKIPAQILAYPKGVVEEAHKITWPTWETTRQLTLTVLAVVAVSTLLIGAMDAVFIQVMNAIIR